MAHTATALLTRPATELAALIHRGEISSRALVEAALEQVAANAHLNAFTLVDAEAALAAADAVQPGDPRPFAGVPTAVKELNAVAGQRLTMASDLFGDYVAPYDDFVVRRIRDAGFISIGRTAAPELGIVPATEPRRFGATRNPWDTGRTPGGSSGGAAAAVAAGILPVAQGSDGGGSIRIPAACCGLVGLKTSRGRISSGPAEGDNFMAQAGALTRTVADAAALLDLLQGYEVGDATWAPPPAESYAETIKRPPRRLRIAFTTDSPLDTAIDPACAQAVEDAAKQLAALGHEVEEATPREWRSEKLFPAFMKVWGAGIATGVRWGAAVSRRVPSRELVETLTWGFYEHGMSKPMPELLEAIGQLNQHARVLVVFFTTFDVLLMPSLGQRPMPIGTIDTQAEDWLVEFQKAAHFTPFTVLWNVTGQPAISVPLYQGADGLPLGVQLAGKPLGEDTLLALAAQLEGALPWAARRPTAAYGV
jgi:amidase